MTNMSARQLTLTIPHICDSIVDHLSSNDVRNCITISKEFHQAFVPYNWRYIHITLRSSYTSLHDHILASEGQVLIENKPRIQALSSVYSEIWDLFLQNDASTPNCIPRAPFASLTSLHALSPPKQDAAPRIDPDYTYQLHTVIENSPRLQELNIIDHCSSTKMQIIQLSRIIRGHPSLKSLTLQTDEMHLGHYKELLWSSWNLEKLDITTSFYNRPKLPAEAYQTDEQEQELDRWLAVNRSAHAAMGKGNNDGKALFQLKEFYLYSGRYLDDFGITIPFLRRCRQLKRFRPPRIACENLLEAIKAEIPNCWPNVEHLDMGNCDPNQRNDDAGLLAAFASPKSRHGGLTSLILAPRHDADILWTIPRKHASTLVDLDLRGCHRILGHSLHTLLTSCRNLRSLLALTDEVHYSKPGHRRFSNFKGDPVLGSRDLEYADSWKCLGLETLHLQFSNGGMSCSEDKYNRAGIPRAIFYQIQKLKRLRDLQLCLVPSTWDDSDGCKHEWKSLVIMWGSSNVCDALKAFGDLKDLETLKLRGLVDYVEHSALTEAKSQWPKLKSVLNS
ncbi:hypothetical protein BGZ74_009718 [Mortierella antarctica]|nr:hypothetical protein BGZ74_009718 [Mortierella antarctica]